MPEAETAAFGQALKDLFLAARSPSLAETAAAAGGERATVQRLSNWRSGRHLPDSFSTLAPVLVWLTVRARDNPESAAPVPSLRQWYRLFTAARQGPAADAQNTSLNARVDAAQFLLAHPDPTTSDPADALPAPRARTTDSDDFAVAVLLLTGINPTTGTPVTSTVPASTLPDAVAELLSVTKLIVPAPGVDTDPHVQWWDPAVTEHWGRAAAVVQAHRPALAARTALVDAAARWTADPQQHPTYTWQQLEVCGEHLQQLPAEPTTPASDDGSPAQYKFGRGVTAPHIPAVARPFWNASHAAALRQLTVHKLIMATVISIIALAVIAGAIAGILTS